LPERVYFLPTLLYSIVQTNGLLRKARCQEPNWEEITVNVISRVRDNVLVLTINRPEAMNSLDPETNQELEIAWRAFEHNDDLRVAVLTGAGTSAFSAGADLKKTLPSFRNQVLANDNTVWSPGGGIARGLDLSKPVIAAVNGHAIAGGLEIALACDIRICSTNATFSLAEAKLGLCPGAGGSQRLFRAVPLSIAMEMLLTGDPIDADTAFRIGLVNRVVASEALMTTAMELATRISKCAPLAIKAIKELAQLHSGESFERAMKVEHDVFLRLMRTNDAKEGYTAFVEKRLPKFIGA
jgi:enoyl-CoA hydratase/carnithine racemase